MLWFYTERNDYSSRSDKVAGTRFKSFDLNTKECVTWINLDAHMAQYDFGVVTQERVKKVNFIQFLEEVLNGRALLL